VIAGFARGMHSAEGPPVYHCYFFLKFFFRQLPLEFTKQHSTKLCHMLGMAQICKCRSEIWGPLS